MTTTATPPAPADERPRPPDHNRAGIDFRRPMPRPPVRGGVIDWHTHLLAARHARDWFAAADHYGIDRFVTMTPLEEALALYRQYPHRLHFIAIPRWQEASPFWLDEWLRRIEAFHNLGSRVVKFHMAPGTMSTRKWRLDSPHMRRLLDEAVARGMIIMTHVGDPDTWYHAKYTNREQYGTRDEHYAMWESVLHAYRQHPWVGAHLGGNPEDLARLQHLLVTYPNLYLDNSATRWMVREISSRRDQARDFFIRNADRLLFGTDQVSGDDRGFDFLSSRFWSHRKLWETAYTGPSPIFDPDLPEEQQPHIRGLALPAEVLQKLYRDNAVGLLARVGVSRGFG
jgi:hypothetical protein